MGTDNLQTQLPVPPTIPAGSPQPVNQNAAIVVSGGDSTPIRPGISRTMLDRAGVRQVNADEAARSVGYNTPGILIPYRTLEGGALEVNGTLFYRLRLDNPLASAKYLSPKGSGAQLYIPVGAPALFRRGGILVVVEGEFKAMSLVDAGIPAVGIGGITSACPQNTSGQPELLPALRQIIEQHRPAKIAFVGDSDTALIPEFSREAIKIAKLVAPTPVILPRTPLDSPAKGIDDLRHVSGEAFADAWSEIVANAEKVDSETNAAELAMRLLRREAGAFCRLSQAAMSAAQKRLVRFAAFVADAPLVLHELVEFAAKYAGLAKQMFRAAVKAEAEKRADESARQVQQDAARRFDAAIEPPLLFDGDRYYRRENDDAFGKLCREDARLHLAMQGFSLSGFGGEPSPADQALHRVQREHRVNFAGPICGRPAGLHVENAIRVLATRSPQMIAGEPGDYNVITEVLRGLFGSKAGDVLAALQIELFIAWLKLGRAAVRNWREHRPGPVLALVGPHDCGKTFVQSALITPALGGRVADPVLWATGATQFNSDLFGAEHLAFGDKSLGEDGRERAHMRDELKRMVASSEYPLHGKHREAITLRPVWRVSLSANDDPESAVSLPALDASFADKIIYLRCYQPAMPFFDATITGAREQFAAAFNAALPAFLYDVDRFDIPAELAKSRFGVREFHHPYIVDLLERSSALMPLAEAVEGYIRSWDDVKTEEALPAVELYAKLDDHLRGRLHTISRTPNALGQQLARLAMQASWKSRLVREERRIKNKQRQTVWRLIREVA